MCDQKRINMICLLRTLALATIIRVVATTTLNSIDTRDVEESTDSGWQRVPIVKPLAQNGNQYWSSLDATDTDTRHYPNITIGEMLKPNVMNDSTNKNEALIQKQRGLQSMIPRLPLYMNCGNERKNYTDPATRIVWTNDRFYSGSSDWNGCPKAKSLKIAIADHLCLTRNSFNIAYNIPVAVLGQYSVRLWFVETFFTDKGRRVFNVSIEGDVKLPNLDVFSEAGGRMIPISRTFNVTVNDGFLTIFANRSVNRAMLSAIEVHNTSLQPLPSPTNPPTPKPITHTPTPTKGLPKPRSPTTVPAKPMSPEALSTIRINCGGKEFVDTKSNNIWRADEYNDRGSTFSRCPREIANTHMDDLFCTYRYFSGNNRNGTYTIPVMPGSYMVRLLFAEIFFESMGERVFHVFVQEQTIRVRFDINSASGGENVATELVSSIQVLSNDPNVRIRLQNVEENSQINGIEIIPNPASAPKTAKPIIPTTAPVTPTFKPFVPTSAPVTPTIKATANPIIPSAAPGTQTIKPTANPIKPTSAPVIPTLKPTGNLTAAPATPTFKPTAKPIIPSAAPITPTFKPTANPIIPSATPVTPTIKPTANPVKPTSAPVIPTLKPTGNLTAAPATPTFKPTANPIVASAAPITPTFKPTANPIIPSATPVTPTIKPTANPVKPTSAPVIPTLKPTGNLTAAPATPTFKPTANPIVASAAPVTPTLKPTAKPIFPTAAPARSQTELSTIRINCGGNEVVDPNGRIWSADTHNQKGSMYSQCPREIANTILDVVICSSRFFSGKDRNGTYTIPALPGSYTISLFFAEIFFNSVDERVFHVIVQNQTIRNNFDIFSASGMKDVATELVSPIEVRSDDPFVRIRFQNVKENAQINGIELIPRLSGNPASGPITSNPTPVPKPATKIPTSQPNSFPTSKPLPPTTVQLSTVRIACGSYNNSIDLRGNQWSKDVHFSGGGRHSFCPSSIGNTDLDDIICEERTWGDGPGRNGTYAVPVKAGSYVVYLHFAELHFSDPRKRVFNVYAQNRLLRKEMDIIAVSGGQDISTVISTIVEVSSSDPYVRLTFQNVIEQSKISGIEILPNDGVNTLWPTFAPTSKPTTPPFYPILINCGYDQPYTDSLSRVWSADKYFSGGLPSSMIRPIENTADDILYHYYREGESFNYEIPVPIADYIVTLYFSENEYTGVGQRVFDIVVEGTNETNVDIFQRADGNFTATHLDVKCLVEAGFLSIQFSRSTMFPSSGVAKISAIKVALAQIHRAHAVATGPYYGTLTDDSSNSAMVVLDAQNSHTHGDGSKLTNFTWKEGNVVLGTTEKTRYSFGVGVHAISLTVVDDSGSDDIEETSVIVNAFGFPAITSLEPINGTIAGGYPITIKGSGFNFSSAEIAVIFGSKEFSGSGITILSPTSIQFIAPASDLAIPVQITVRTPRGVSAPNEFTYLGVPIRWLSATFLTFSQPLVARFGPDKKLYIGTREGSILKITMNEDFTVINNNLKCTVNADQDAKAIFGLAFDPTETGAHPGVYFTSSNLFHKGTDSSSGSTISGKIRRASGSTLDTVIDIITGLPTSRYDHGLNGILFGDNGELYFTSGSHTNGGVNDGKLSNFILKENFLSAAVNVAYISHPDFNGSIVWSKADDGNMIAKGIDVFAPGMRNPYCIMLHTNGNMYGTDNGPNKGFGSMSIGCNGQKKADDSKEDEVNLIKKGRYYGSPNLKRAEYFNDARQCVWQPPEKPDSDNHAAPLLTHSSSIDGIIEFHGNHFAGMLRYNLIYTHYQRENNIYRAILTEDGQAVLPALDKKGVPLNIGRTGLDIIQAPNGNLIEVSYKNDQVNYYKPDEDVTTTLIVKTCWPYRGHSSGGSNLSIFGVNLNTAVSVTVGGINCPLTYISDTRVDCLLQGGVGTVDIVVSNGVSTSTFERGYRYISGSLPQAFILPVYSG